MLVAHNRLTPNKLQKDDSENRGVVFKELADNQRVARHGATRGATGKVGGEMSRKAQTPPKLLEPHIGEEPEFVVGGIQEGLILVVTILELEIEVLVEPEVRAG